MTLDRACAACVELNAYRSKREAEVVIAGVPLCKEHLSEATRDSKSAAARFLESMSRLTQRSDRT